MLPKATFRMVNPFLVSYDLSLASIRPDQCYHSPSMQPDLLHLHAPSLPLP